MREPASNASADPQVRAIVESFLLERLGHVPRPWPVALEREVTDLVDASGEGGHALQRALRTASAATRLVHAATVGYTEFFRHKEHFARMRELFSARTRALHIHSVGCSTGEEPYSIALLTLELGLRARILASDVDASAIEHARRGEYQKGPPGSAPGPYRVPDEARAMIEWRVGSLGTLGAGMRFDLVVCRNVLIYFDAEALRALVSHLTRQLAPEGRLVVAPVEALVVGSDELVHEAPLGWFRARRDEGEPVAPSMPRARAAEPSRPPLRDGPLDVAARAMAAGALDAAETLLREVLRTSSVNAEAWFLLGEVLERRGERSQSRVAFTEAARHADGTHDALGRAAERRARRGG